MNSRERILAAITHKEADRVPVDLGGMRSTGMMAVTYARLKEYLGISEGATLVFDAGQQLALIEEPILRRYNADVVPLDLGTLKSWKAYTLPDGTPTKIRADFEMEPDGEGGWYQVSEGVRLGHMPASSYYFDSSYHPLADASPAEIDAYQLGEMCDADLRLLEQEARRLYSETDYAIMGGFGGAFLEAGEGLRGWDQFLVDLAIDRPLAEAILQKVLENNIKNVRRYLDAVGKHIQLIQVGGDLGTQAGPQVRPQWYYEVLQPLEKAFWSEIHRLADVKIFLHSCGGIYDLIPGIIDAGCDVLNPVQTSARGMDPVQLKREFGGKITFWGGGCDTQSILPFATPDEVYTHVSERVNIFKPGGGFVFCQVHNIQANVPLQNIEAMYRAIRDNWNY